MTYDRASIATLLRRSGFRATTGRCSLIAALASHGKPLTVEEICASLKPALDPATVYRALGEFAAAGIVRRIDFRHGHAHYELAKGDDHHHLICTSCHRVEDISGCPINALAKKALRESGAFAEVTGHALELFGLCRRCIKK